MRADDEVEVGIALLQRVGVRPGPGPPRRQHPRLLPRQPGRHLAQVTAQHVVHARRHVLDPAAGQDGDVRGGVPGHRSSDLVQRRQAARQLHEHEAGTPEQVGVQPVQGERPGQARASRVGLQGPLGGQPVGVDAYLLRPVQPDRTEREGAVLVPDHHHVARGGSGEQVGRGVQQQPVGGVDRHQVRGLDVGGAAQVVQEGHAREPTEHRLGQWCGDRVPMTPCR